MSKYTETPAIHDGKGHTPGHWHVVPYGDGDSLVICSDEAGNLRIAFMATPGCRDDLKRRASWKRIKANARLIAAAPELLDVLKELTELAHLHMIGGYGHAIDNARAAITKAEG